MTTRNLGPVILGIFAGFGLGIYVGIWIACKTWGLQ